MRKSDFAQDVVEIDERTKGPSSSLLLHERGGACLATILKQCDICRAHLANPPEQGKTETHPPHTFESPGQVASFPKNLSHAPKLR